MTILGDILDFSKIDHNSMELEAVPVLLRDAVEATMDMAAADAYKRGIELAYSLDPRLAQRRVMGDMTRIRQVLNNLVSNAVKFTESGDVVVDVRVDPAPAPTQAALAALQSRVPRQLVGSQGSQDGRCCLHVAVRDTGIGIAPEAMSRLFQSFRQGHESMTRRYGGTGTPCVVCWVLDGYGWLCVCAGVVVFMVVSQLCATHTMPPDTVTGLGLAISRGLAERMGGTIWVESEVGKGSTFHFTALLPWAEGQDGISPASTSYAISHGSDSNRCVCVCVCMTHHCHPPVDLMRHIDMLATTPLDSSSAELSRSRPSLERLQGTPWRQGEWAPSSVDGSTLVGKRVLVDCPHAATAVQIVQMCDAMGMVPSVGACAEQPPGPCTMAIVFTEHVASVLRGPWRSLPIVALGGKVRVQ